MSDNEQTIEHTKQSYGERLVRVAFNPSGNDVVDELKRTTATIIDLIQAHKALDPRLAALSVTTYEAAAMWAVKLMTTKAE